MNGHRTLVAVAMIVALALAGCGGDDDSLPETPVTGATEGAGPIAKDDFIAQADGVCAEVNAAVGTVDSSSTDTASAAGQRADLYEGMMERIRDLGQPDDDAGLSDVLAAGDELVQAEQDARLAAERGDDAGLAEAQSEASSALAAFQSAADSYGLEECGQGPSAPTAIPTTPGATVPAVPTEPPPVTPVTPVTPTPPAPPPAPTAPTGGAGTGGGTGGSTGGGDDGANTGSGGIGPG